MSQIKIDNNLLGSIQNYLASLQDAEAKKLLSQIQSVVSEEQTSTQGENVEKTSQEKDSVSESVKVRLDKEQEFAESAVIMSPVSSLGKTFENGSKFVVSTTSAFSSVGNADKNYVLGVKPSNSSPAFSAISYNSVASSIEPTSLLDSSSFIFDKPSITARAASIRSQSLNINAPCHESAHFGLLFSAPLLALRKISHDSDISNPLLGVNPGFNNQSDANASESKQKYVPMEMLDFSSERREVLDNLAQEVRRPIRYRQYPATLYNLQLALSHNICVLHFSGHGTKNGELLFEDENGVAKIVNAEMLGRVLKQHDGRRSLRVVLLASCYSSNMANAFIQSGVEYVVCIRLKDQVMDFSSIKFAKTFYLALFSGSYSVADSFSQAKFAVEATCKVDGESEKFLLVAHPDSKYMNPLSNVWPSGPLLFSDLDGGNQMRNCTPRPLFHILPSSHQSKLIGRNFDLQNLFQLVSKNRFCSLVGATGIGKSSVVKQLCHHLLERGVFTHGIIFTTLQFCSSRQSVWSAIYRSIQKSLLATRSEFRQAVSGAQNSIEKDFANLIDSNSESGDNNTLTQDVQEYLINNYFSYRILFVFDNAEDPIKTNMHDFYEIIEWFLRELPSSSLFLTSMMNVNIPSAVSTPQKIHNLMPLNPIDAALLFRAFAPRDIPIEELTARYTPSIIARSNSCASVHTPISTRPPSPNLWSVSHRNITHSRNLSSMSPDLNNAGGSSIVHSSSHKSLSSLSCIAASPNNPMYPHHHHHRLSLESLGNNSVYVNSSARNQFLNALATHPVLKMLAGHPGSISVVTPLLHNYKMFELEIQLATQSIDELVLSNVPEEQRFLMKSFTKSIQANLEYLYSTDKCSPAFFALFALLPGGATTEDLEAIWPRELVLPKLATIFGDHKNSVFEDENVAVSVLSSATFLVNLLRRNTLVVVSNMKYAIFSFFTAVADHILRQDDRLRRSLTLCCYNYFANIAERIFLNLGSSDGKDPFNTHYELFAQHEYNMRSCVQKWGSEPVDDPSFSMDRGICSYGRVCAYFATLLFLVDGRIEDSFQICEVGLAGCQYLGSRLGENALLKLMGILKYMLHQFDEALSYFKQAERNYKMMKCVLGQAIVSNAIANIYFKQENYPKSIEEYKKSLLLFRSISHLHGQSDCLKRLGALVKKSHIGSKVEATTLSKKYFDDNKKLFENSVSKNSVGYVSRWVGEMISLHLTVPTTNSSAVSVLTTSKPILKSQASRSALVKQVNKSNSSYPSVSSNTSVTLKLKETEPSVEKDKVSCSTKRKVIPAKKVVVSRTKNDDYNPHQSPLQASKRVAETAISPSNNPVISESPDQGIKITEISLNQELSFSPVKNLQALTNESSVQFMDDVDPELLNSILSVKERNDKVEIEILISSFERLGLPMDMLIAAGLVFPNKDLSKECEDVSFSPISVISVPKLTKKDSDISETARENDAADLELHDLVDSDSDIVSVSVLKSSSSNSSVAFIEMSSDVSALPESRSRKVALISRPASVDGDSMKGPVRNKNGKLSTNRPEFVSIASKRPSSATSFTSSVVPFKPITHTVDSNKKSLSVAPTKSHKRTLSASKSISEVSISKSQVDKSPAITVLSSIVSEESIAVCHKCQKPGHYANKCPVKTFQSSSTVTLDKS